MDSGIGGVSEDRESDFQTSALNYSKPEYSANYTRGFLQKIYPSVAPQYTQELSTHHFTIGSENDDYFIDLQNIFANVKFKVLKVDGNDFKNLTPTDNVSMISDFAHSLFWSIDVFLNNTLVSDHGRHASLRGYLTNLVSTSKGVKRSILSADGFISVDKKEVNKDLTTGNCPLDKVYALNRRLITGSKEVSCYFQPHFDLISCPRLIPGGNNLKFVFTQAPSDFLLIGPTHATDKFVLQLSSFNLEVQRVLPNRQALKHVEAAKKIPMNFPITRTQIRTRQILSGQIDIVLPRLIESTSQLPYQIIIIPVENEQFNKFTVNPYVWSPGNIASINLTLNGVSIPQEAFNLVTDKQRAYKLSMKALGFTETSGINCGISYEDWLKEHFFMAFDLTNCWCAG